MSTIPPHTQISKITSHFSIKPCVDCGEQSTERFYYHANGRQNGIRCISCQKQWRREMGMNQRMNLKNKYGLTVDAYENMVCRQAGRCAICGKVSQNGKLVIDHSHQTNQVRELLCNTCNVLLGYVEKDRSRVQLALDYLARHEQTDFIQHP